MVYAPTCYVDTSILKSRDNFLFWHLEIENHVQPNFSSNTFACASVRGKPSSKIELLSSMLFTTRSTIKSSGTRLPALMKFAASLPRGVELDIYVFHAKKRVVYVELEAVGCWIQYDTQSCDVRTSFLNRSPLDTWLKEKSSTRREDRVPLPEPGAPKMAHRSNEFVPVALKCLV